MNLDIGLVLLYLFVVVICFYVMTKVVDGYFLKSLDNMARWMKLTPSVAGATLLAMGTSAPELSTTFFALFLANANPATGIGTVVGSAIFQILVVIGFASLVKTAYLDWQPVIRDGIFYAVTVLVLILVLRDGIITTSESGMLLLIYFVYLIVLFVWSRKVKDKGDPDPIEEFEKEVDLKSGTFSYLTAPIDLIISIIPDPNKRKNFTLPVFGLSLVIIAFASYWLVIAAEGLAYEFGLSPAIIALTILAGGSSVPELISSFIISKQGRGDMAVSNAIGSNTFDILVSLGLPVFIYTIISGSPANAVDTGTINSSVFLLFATLISVLTLLALQKFKAGKRFGLILIAAYAVYVIATYAGII